jgi:ElaB/YqjD/DUF883 family membrane-anchored ribosome-binding protein
MKGMTHPVAEAGASLRQATAQAGPVLHELASSAQHLAHGSTVAVRERATRLGDAGAAYVRDHPMQSVLIAAGAGAALVLVLRTLARSR